MHYYFKVTYKDGSENSDEEWLDDVDSWKEVVKHEDEMLKINADIGIVSVSLWDDQGNTGYVSILDD